MKKLGLLLLIALAACSDKHNQTTDLERSNINGPVDSWVERTFEAQMREDELLLGKELTTSIFEYNKKGNVVKTIYEVPAYRYSETTVNNEDGNPVSITFRDAEQESSIFVDLTLNKDGSIAHEHWKDEQERMDSRYENEYENSQLMRTKVYNKHNELNLVRSFHYSKEGLVDTAFSFNGVGALQYYVVKSYEGKELISSKSYKLNKEGEPELNIYIENNYAKRDEHGNWTEKVSKVNNLISNETTYRVIRREIKYRTS